MSSAVALSERLALVFTPSGAREPIAALETVVAEIRAGLADGLDHTVAHTRLVWWREEVTRLERGAPLHPASRALISAAPKARYERLDALLTACEFLLAGHQPASEVERSALYSRLFGPLEALRCELIHGRAEPALDVYAAAFAQVRGQAERLEWADGANREAASRALREALLALNRSLTGAAAERYGLVIAGLCAHRLQPRGLGPEPKPLRALYLAWRCVRRHRLEIV